MGWLARYFRVGTQAVASGDYDPGKERPESAPQTAAMVPAQLPKATLGNGRVRQPIALGDLAIG
jgi:hypothetical protein